MIGSTLFSFQTQTNTEKNITKYIGHELNIKEGNSVVVRHSDNSKTDV